MESSQRGILLKILSVAYSIRYGCLVWSAVVILHIDFSSCKTSTGTGHVVFINALFFFLCFLQNPCDVKHFTMNVETMFKLYRQLNTAVEEKEMCN